MPFTALVTDSTAGVPKDLAAEHGIRIVPLYVKIGEASYRDGLDITPEELYERLPNSVPLPTTSQPSVGDFAAVYSDLVNQGASGIISVHLSSGISGTVNSARLAAQQVGSVPIEVIDTRCASGVALLSVQAGARALSAGASFDGTVAVMRNVVERQRTVFTLDTLEYLYKGGRIGGAAALVGSLLQFKPLLYFKEGQVDVLERVRKSSRALARMVEIMVKWVGNEEPMHVVVMQAACADRAEELAGIVRQHMKVADVQIGVLTPVLGVHGGPGTLGICCCPLSASKV
jgi:DegV family protein with EDD domain